MPKFLTSEHIESKIKAEHFFTADQGVFGAIADAAIQEDKHVTPADAPPVNTKLELLTICVIELQNGFTVLGSSACADPAKFDAEIGRRLARSDAVSKIWPLEGYLLKESLSLEATAIQAHATSGIAMPHADHVAAFMADQTERFLR